MFAWSFCDGFFGFFAIGFSICGSSIPGRMPAGVLELIEQLFSSYLMKLWRAIIAQVWCPVVIKQMVMKFN
jgi:hypothetical protein